MSRQPLGEVSAEQALGAARSGLSTAPCRSRARARARIALAGSRPPRPITGHAHPALTPARVARAGGGARRRGRRAARASAAGSRGRAGARAGPQAVAAASARAASPWRVIAERDAERVRSACRERRRQAATASRSGAAHVASAPFFSAARRGPASPNSPAAAAAYMTSVRRRRGRAVRARGAENRPASRAVRTPAPRAPLGREREVERGERLAAGPPSATSEDARPSRALSGHRSRIGRVLR